MNSPRRELSDVALLTLAISVLWLLLTGAQIADQMIDRYLGGGDIRPALALQDLLVNTMLSVAVTPLLIHLLRPSRYGARLGAAAWMRFGGVVLAVAILRILIGLITGVAFFGGALTWQRVKMSLLLDTHTHAIEMTIAGAVILLYYNAQSGVERERLRAALNISRLQQLRVQFRPQFLLDTLNTIATLVHREPKAADNLITSLGSLLRSTLELDDVAEITLEEELELAQNYLKIQQVRLSARLATSIDAADDALRCTVVPLVLQPLVENAIIHGLAQAHPTGRITITARIDGDALVLQVRNNGSADPAKVRRGTGLKNLEERLTTMYGGRATLAFCTEATDFVAEVRIPARGEDHDSGTAHR